MYHHKALLAGGLSIRTMYGTGGRLLTLAAMNLTAMSSVLRARLDALACLTQHTTLV
jgi:hypothetical protein